MGYVGSELSNAQVRSDGEDFRCFMQGFSQWVSGSYRIDPITGTAIFPRPLHGYAAAGFFEQPAASCRWSIEFPGAAGLVCVPSI